MKGIDLNKAITYKHSSLRFFNENEFHVNRTCNDDVLLLVYDGVLRFWEDGTEYEVHSGEYHIQKHGSVQKGNISSSAPKYLYVHFLAEWAEDSNTLSFKGNFDYSQLKPLIEKMDKLAHGDYTKTERTATFTEIISRLYRQSKPISTADNISGFLMSHYGEDISLERLSKNFNFSKNHIINIFKKEYGVTPTDYLNSIRIQKAKHLLEATSLNAEDISLSCGFHNYSHFYRLFMRENGISPTKWRERKRISPT